jgi:hexokinase
MGKGFLANEGLLGEDLGEIIETACRKKGLHVELSAIVNDSSAALLSEAYNTPSTRFGLILGTGVNIAAHLPVTTIDQPKFGERPSSWHEKASHVIVNTEVGMFGHDILPLTKWDKLLSAAHPRPEFQPLEHLVSGYYLGEVCRLALLDAIPSTGILGGTVPPSLQKPYSLDTETLSIIEAYVTRPFSFDSLELTKTTAIIL